MKIIIIGSGGFLGKHLSCALAKMDGVASLSLITRTDSRYCEDLAATYPHVETIRSENPDDLPGDLFSPGAIFIDLSSNIGPRSFAQFSLPAAVQNLDAKFRLYQRISHVDDAHLFYASSGGTVYAPEGDLRKTEDSAVRASSVYSFCKLSDENLLASLFGDRSAFTIMRISNPYGPGQVFKNLQGVAPVLINCLRNETPFKVIGSLNDIRDYIFIDDLMEAICTLIGTRAKHRNKIYNLGSGTACSLRHFIGTMEAITRKKVAIIGGGEGPARGHYLGIDKVTATTAWRPITDLHAGLEIWLSLEFPELLKSRQATSTI